MVLKSKKNLFCNDFFIWIVVKSKWCDIKSEWYDIKSDNVLKLIFLEKWDE